MWINADNKMTQEAYKYLLQHFVMSLVKANVIIKQVSHAIRLPVVTFV